MVDQDMKSLVKGLRLELIDDLKRIENTIIDVRKSVTKSQISLGKELAALQTSLDYQRDSSKELKTAITLMDERWAECPARKGWDGSGVTDVSNYRKTINGGNGNKAMLVFLLKSLGISAAIGTGVGAAIGSGYAAYALAMAGG
jgi:hypothetical protein